MTSPDDALAAARQATEDAECWALDRSLDPPPNLDGIPPWSAVSKPAEQETRRRNT